MENKNNLEKSAEEVKQLLIMAGNEKLVKNIIRIINSILSTN